MSIRLEVSDTVLVRVKGELPVNEQGVRPAFDFSLICVRVATDELKSITASSKREGFDEPEGELGGGDNKTLEDFIVEKTRDWRHVLDAQGGPVPYSEAGLRQLMGIINMPQLIGAAYLTACGSKGKEKN